MNNTDNSITQFNSPCTTDGTTTTSTNNQVVTEAKQQEGTDTQESLQPQEEQQQQQKIEPIIATQEDPTMMTLTNNSTTNNNTIAPPSPSMDFADILFDYYDNSPMSTPLHNTQSPLNMMRKGLLTRISELKQMNEQRKSFHDQQTQQIQAMNMAITAASSSTTPSSTAMIPIAPTTASTTSSDAVTELSLVLLDANNHMSIFSATSYFDDRIPLSHKVYFNQRRQHFFQKIIKKLNTYAAVLPFPPNDMELHMIVKMTTLKVRVLTGCDSSTGMSESVRTQRNQQMIIFLNDYLLSLTSHFIKLTSPVMSSGSGMNTPMGSNNSGSGSGNGTTITAAFSVYDARTSRWYGKLVDMNSVASCDISIGIYQDRSDPSLFILDSRREAGDTKLFIQGFFHPLAAMIQGREQLPGQGVVYQPQTMPSLMLPSLTPPPLAPAPAAANNNNTRTKRGRTVDGEEVEEQEVASIIGQQGQQQEGETRRESKRSSSTSPPSVCSSPYTPSNAMMMMSIPRMPVETYLANMQSTLRLLRQTPYMETKIMALNMLASMITSSSGSTSAYAASSSSSSSEKDYIEDERIYIPILQALQESIIGLPHQQQQEGGEYAVQEVAVFALRLLINRLSQVANIDILMHISPFTLQWLQRQIIVAHLSVEHLTIAMQRAAAEILYRLSTLSSSNAVSIAVMLFASPSTLMTLSQVSSFTTSPSSNNSSFSASSFSSASTAMTLTLSSELIDGLKVWIESTLFTLTDPMLMEKALLLVDVMMEALKNEVERATD